MTGVVVEERDAPRTSSPGYCVDLTDSRSLGGAVDHELFVRDRARHPGSVSHYRDARRRDVSPTRRERTVNSRPLSSPSLPEAPGRDAQRRRITAVGILATLFGVTSLSAQIQPLPVAECSDAGLINVRCFGARGDGVSDDTVALQAAFSFIAANEGKLYLPTGVYLTRPLTIVTAHTEKNFTIVGDGRRTTELRAMSGSAPLLTIGDGTRLVNYIGISGLRFNGVTQTAVGIHLNHVANSVFRDVYVENCSDGLFLSGTLACGFYECDFKDNRVGVEMMANSRATANLLRFRDCAFTSNREWALQCRHVMMLILDGCQIEDNGNPQNRNATGGIWVDVKNFPAAGTHHWSQVIIRQCWLEQNHGRAVSLNGGWITIDNSLFILNPVDGIVADAASLQINSTISPSAGVGLQVTSVGRVAVISSTLAGASLPPNTWVRP